MVCFLFGLVCFFFPPFGILHVSEDSQGGCGGRGWLCVFLSGNLWIPLTASYFSFSYTNMLLALLLLLTPVCPVAASCPLCHCCFNSAVRKLHQKEIKREKAYFWQPASHGCHSACCVLWLYNVGISKRRRKVPIYPKALATAAPQ